MKPIDPKVSLLLLKETCSLSAGNRLEYFFLDQSLYESPREVVYTI